MKSRVAFGYMAIDNSDDSIAGYYTLSAISIWLLNIPEALRRKLPRYPDIPAAMIGRLAVAVSQQGRGLGGAMLFDAMERTARSDLAVYAMVADAIDENAERFYLHHEFQKIEGAQERRLFFPLNRFIP